VGEVPQHQVRATTKSFAGSAESTACVIRSGVQTAIPGVTTPIAHMSIENPEPSVGDNAQAMNATCSPFASSICGAQAS
jgi:hypothetical protein